MDFPPRDEQQNRAVTATIPWMGIIVASVMAVSIVWRLEFGVAVFHDSLLIFAYQFQ